MPSGGAAPSARRAIPPGARSRPNYRSRLMTLLSHAARRWFVARDPRALARRWAYRPVLLRLEDRTLPSFITAPEYLAGPFPWSVAVGDLDGDGDPDLAVANSSSGTVSVLKNQGGGTFAAALSYAV